MIVHDDHNPQNIILIIIIMLLRCLITIKKLDSGKTTNNTAMIRDIYTKKKESPLEVQQLAVWLEGGPVIIVRSFNGVCVW